MSAYADIVLKSAYADMGPLSAYADIWKSEQDGSSSAFAIGDTPSYVR
jgi:hypothetical protein